VGTGLCKIVSCRLLPMTFGRKRVKLDKLMDSRLQWLKSGIVDSKTYRNIPEKKDYVSLGSIGRMSVNRISSRETYPNMYYSFLHIILICRRER